jgi:hypothetical protein
MKLAALQIDVDEIAATTEETASATPTAPIGGVGKGPGSALTSVRRIPVLDESNAER